MPEEKDTSDHNSKVAKGSFWGILGNLGIKLISFIYVILIARVVSQNDVGIFYLALSILSLPSIIDDLGFPAAISRYVPFFEGKRDVSRIRGLMRISTIAVFLSGLIFSILFFLSADKIGETYNNPHLAEIIKILSPYLVLNNLLSLFTTYLQSRFAIKQSQIVLNLQNIAKLILTLLCFYIFGASVFSLSLSFILAAVMVVFISAYFVIKQDKNLPKSDSHIDRGQIINEIMPFGLALGLISSLSTVITSSDKILLGYLIDPLTVNQVIATYSIATNMAGLLSLLSGGIGSVFSPLVSKLAANNDRNEIKKIMETSTRWLLFLLIPTAVVFISFAEDIMRHLYGQEYVVGANSLIIFSIGIVISSAFYTVICAIGAIRKIRYEIYIVLAAGVANVIFNILLIPVFGMDGAAIASALGYVIIAIMLRHYGKKLFDFSLPVETIKIVIAGALSFMILFFMHPIIGSFFSTQIKEGATDSVVYKFLNAFLIGVLVLVSMGIFVIFSIWLKCFKKEDTAMMKKILIRLQIPAVVQNRLEKIMASAVND